MKFKDLRVIDIIQIVPPKEDWKFKDMWVKIYLLVPFPVCLPDLCSIFKIALYLTHISDILLIRLYIWYILFYFFLLTGKKWATLFPSPSQYIIFVIYLLIIFSSWYMLRKGPATKSDEFSEKNPNGLRPPPLILENYVAIFFYNGYNVLAPKTQI